MKKMYPGVQFVMPVPGSYASGTFALISAVALAIDNAGYNSAVFVAEAMTVDYENLKRLINRSVEIVEHATV